jgi:putative nucleotidyltransferase with HDIG domain
MPEASTPLSRLARAYIAAVVATGLIAVATSAYDLWIRAVGAGWLVLALLTFLTGAFSIKLPSVHARISVSEAFVFAAVILFGPSAATMIVALDAMIMTSWSRQGPRSRLRGIFNVSAGTAAIWLAAHLFKLLLPQTPEAPSIEELLVPVAVLATSYFCVNSFLVAYAVSFERKASPIQIWKDNFVWVGLNYLGGSCVAMLLATYRTEIDFAALSVIIPILVIIYLTFRTSLGRLADAHHHVTQVNELYLSTIEALAMAVDAKDQITHGHIRRVQVYATELAKRLGVTERSQLKAIEAAALLHDMGKLAIPEHILNKPGKLTPAEFETMKTHANIGADLLSSIRFPYPVVPIVRHHHENWNGTGYPDGIVGADIPLGARILSVVDCFDALNSDRPYRPKLEIAEAFEVLQERRGTMYDPLVVDAFVNAFHDIEPAAREAGEHARTLFVTGENQTSASSQNPFDEIRSAAADGAALAITRLKLSEAATRDELWGAAWEGARLVTPATVCVYFAYVPDSDGLTCEQVSSSDFQFLIGESLRPGERISGWVGAHRQTISNSDPTLDLGPRASALTPRPRSTISTPIVSRDGTFHGVMTGYSTTSSAFSHKHEYAFEQLANELAQRLAAMGASAYPSGSLTRR